MEGWIQARLKQVNFELKLEHDSSDQDRLVYLFDDIVNLVSDIIHRVGFKLKHRLK